MISHAPDGDAFFDVIKKGAQEAADKDNVEFKYSSSGEVPEQSTFIQNAIDSKVDGIAVSLPDPDALAPVSRRPSQPASRSSRSTPATAPGRRPAHWPSTASPRSWPASSPAPSSTSSVPSTPCASLQAQGQVQLEDRCAGITSKFSGTTEKLYAKAPTPRSTSQPCRPSCARTRASTRSSPSARRSASRCSSSSSRTAAPPRSSPTRSTTTCIPLLQNGKVAFTIDQQPYLQGYLSIDSLWLYNKNKSVIGAQQSIPTGPVVIDQSNIGDIVDDVKAGLR